MEDADTTELAPKEDVYSYFLFSLPIEEKKAPGKLTYHKVLIYLLVIACIFIQFTMLYAIFTVTVLDDLEWQKSIVRTDDLHGQCNPGGSLCNVKDGKDGANLYSCAPPTVQLSGRWEELDTNGDGIWTKEEVLSSRAELKCKYIVDPYEVFQVFIKFLILREKVIWLHPDIYNFKAIHRFYFTYAMGDVVMCGYRNEDMCPNLLRKGVFDGPLKYGTAPRVGTTIDSALAYCYGLLEDGGYCERFLPSTYGVWKRRSESQCGGTDFSPFVYTHPTGDATKSMLAVDYGARTDYKRADSSSLFMSFKICIIIMYLLAMFMEVKAISPIVMWIVSYPSSSAYGDDSVQEVEDPMNSPKHPHSPKFTVKGVSPRHRSLVTLITLIRLAMVLGSIWVGLSFLLRQTDYLSLLLDGLGLIFIQEIVKIPYDYILDPSLKEQFDKTEPMDVPVREGCGWWSRSPAARDVLFLVLLLLLCAGNFIWHYDQVVVPMSHALRCTCLTEGELCHEYHRFSRQWWEDYWVKRVPAVFENVAKLKATTDSAAFVELPSERTLEDVQSMAFRAEQGIIALANVSYSANGLGMQGPHRHRKQQAHTLLSFLHHFS